MAVQLISVGVLNQKHDEVFAIELKFRYVILNSSFDDSANVNSFA